MQAQNTEVVDVPEAGHYALRVDGEEAGVSNYRRVGDTVTFTHTEVPPELQGQGLGGILVRGSLDDVRRRGLRVVPLCPFVEAWIDRHPEYADLVRA
ncbi:MAG: GNAT family N-acetyltransferase [Actinomycetota bacterium]